MNYGKWIGNSVKLGAVVGLVSYVLALVFKIIPIPKLIFAMEDINVRQQITTGIDTSVSGKLLSFMGGVIPEGFMGFLLVILAGIVLVIIGSLLVALFKVKGSGIRKLWYTMILGAIVIALFVQGMSALKIGFISTLIAIVIYYLIVTIIVHLLAKKSAAIKKLLPS